MRFNLYASRNLKYLIALPLLLLVFGIYFSFHIPLDSSLRGGVSILLETNSSLSAQQLAARLSAVLRVPGIEIAKSPGGFQITLPINQSLANADSYLSEFYQLESNYSAVQLNYTTVSLALQSNPNNATLQSKLKNDSLLLNKYFSQLKNVSSAIVQAVSPFVPNATVNESSIVAMQNSVQQAYSLATSRYENITMSQIRSVLPYSSFSFEEVTPTLGKYFLSQFKSIILSAFILVFIAVFFLFRSVIPSITVTFGAANDMIIALGMMGLFHIPLGVTSIAGLLMIIGYAIDTDVLSAIRILKRGEGSVEERAYASMRTGLTMTFSAIISFLVLFTVSVLVYVPTYFEISSVVLMGLIGDIFTTWFGNVPLLMIYKKRKERI